MTLRMNYRTTIRPQLLSRACTRAEHTVAVQAERDSRRYIPKASGRLRGSGRVHGSTIVWDAPYARLIYFGTVYVDPKYGKGGFPYSSGVFRSRPGVKKVSSGRKFNFRNGEYLWFYQAKKVGLMRWVRLAEKEIGHVG